MEDNNLTLLLAFICWCKHLCFLKLCLNLVTFINKGCKMWDLEDANTYYCLVVIHCAATLMVWEGPSCFLESWTVDDDCEPKSVLSLKVKVWVGCSCSKSTLFHEIKHFCGLEKKIHFPPNITWEELAEIVSCYYIYFVCGILLQQIVFMGTFGMRSQNQSLYLFFQRTSQDHLFFSRD